MNPDDSSPALSEAGEAPDDDAQRWDDRPERRYSREGLLGIGGMGQVYAARDARLQRLVAVKVAATPELAGRLAREACITAQLEHPGIVPVYDAGETDGQIWYVMRLIRGKTLRDRITDCPGLPERLALVPHLHAACQAVAYAHAMGFVHRDLKPSNVMVGEFGETQVADWGLATPIQTSADAPQLGPAGTRLYMSPELLQGGPASTSSDVYALGAALFELLSGQPPPVTGPLTLPGDAPRALAAIARRCLQAEPGARYPSAIALAEDLDRWLSGRRVLAYEYQPLELLARLIRAWRAPILVGSVALLVLAGVIVLAVSRNARERSLAEANLSLALTQQARAALWEERIPEAQLLAAHALRLAPSPEARGVLAGASRADVSLVSRTPLPAICQHNGVVDPAAKRLACHGEGRLEIWDIGAMTLGYAFDLHLTESPVWVGERLLVASPDALSWISDGVVSRALHKEGWPLAAGERAFVVQGARVWSLSPGAEPVAFETCPSTRSATLVVDGALWVGCEDGELRAYNADGTLFLTVPLGERPAWSTAVADAAGLRVGRLDGTVQTLADGQWGAPLRGSAGSIRALLPVPGAALVLALGERGGPRIWSTAVDAWVGGLPAGASRMAAGGADGEVLLVGESLERWRIAPNPRPTSFQFDVGISQVTVSPDGEALAVALGSGEVVERRIRDGLALRRWRWSDQVAKCVAYASGGAVVGAAMGAPGRWLGPGETSADLPLPGVLRRVGRLSDGRVWALGYGDVVFLIDPSGAASSQPVGSSPFDGSSSPDGRTAVIVDAQGGVWALEGSTWRELRRVPDATAVDIGDGGAPLVVARRRTVCADAVCMELDDDVLDVAVFGDRVAVATVRGVVHLFDARSGAPLAVLYGHSGRVSSVEFGPDGRWLLSASWDGTVRLWDLSELGTPAEVLVAEAEARWGMGLEDLLRGL